MLVTESEMKMATEPRALPAAYTRAAIYSHDSDCVEYVQKDVFCLYERIDARLTLIKDSTGHNLIGFKIKGFHGTFQHLRAAYDLSDRQYVSLVAAFEAIYTEIGEELTRDSRIRAAYQAAYQLAANDNVQLSGLGLKLAA